MPGGSSGAADRFESFRLPGVFAGLDRATASFPVQYVGASIPQARAAGSVFQLVQMMLGLEADVPNGRLRVDPTLPAWIPSLKLGGLKIDRTRLDLCFWREGDGTRFAVESQDGDRLDVLAGPTAPPVTTAARTGPMTG